MVGDAAKAVAVAGPCLPKLLPLKSTVQMVGDAAITVAVAGPSAPKSLLLISTVCIVGQRFFRLHVDSHLLMLQLAWQTRDWSEAVGQVFRLGLVPFGHLLGRLPAGNPGTADVSAFSTQEITPCLRDLIAKARKG